MKNLCIVILSLTAAVSIFGQTKTVTNSDLEKFRQKRIESEKKLREDYARMGFPSPEELEKQNEKRRAELEQYSTQLSQQRVQSQNDLVIQANVLRTQIASIDAQINYLRRQSNGYSNQSFAYSYGFAPYGYRINRPIIRQNQQLPPNMQTVQDYANMYPSSQSLYNQSIGNVRIGGNLNNNRGNYRGGYIAPIIGGGNYVQNEANGQLLYLEQTRAGLLAEWRILEEQARRAGVRID
ncbi:MAG: hypothetical protein ABJA66_15670 [Actinomycetota bacterium]